MCCCCGLGMRARCLFLVPRAGVCAGVWRLLAAGGGGEEMEVMGIINYWGGGGGEEVESACG